jgi:hypothetical protein
MNSKTWAGFTLALLLSTNALAETGRQVSVYTEAEQESYMWTMTKDTFWGGLFGLLIGGAIMLISDFEADPMILAYSTGAGMIGGAGFGLWEILDRRDQVRGPTTALESPPKAMIRFTFRF